MMRQYESVTLRATVT